MKSTTAGVYQKLKSSAVQWNEKLTLAQWAWDCEECLIPNKQQVLLDWIIHELVNTNKRDFQTTNNDLLEGQWNFLLHAIQSKELIQARIPVSLKPQLLQVFTGTFSQGQHVIISNSTTDVIVQCCYTVLSSPQLGNSLLAKYESYVSFLSSLLSFFIPVCLAEGHDLHLLIKVCLEKFLEMQRQQASQKKVFVSTCQQLLQPVAMLHHKLQMAMKKDNATSNSPNKRKIKEMQNLLEIVLARSLFHKDHITEYPQALIAVRDVKQNGTDEPVQKKPRISSYPKLLFDKLKEMLSSRSLELLTDTIGSAPEIVKGLGVLTCLPFLFKAFIESRRKWHSSTSAVEFDFFTEVCEMIGLNSQSQSHAVDCLLLLHELLDCLEFHNIYQVAEDHANGSQQFNSLKHLTDIVVRMLESGDAACKCLDVLLKLNHLLLEPHLQEIWRTCWRVGNDCSPAQNNLMSSLLSTYSKLRQFDKLVRTVLCSLKNVGPSVSGCHTLPMTFTQNFTEAIQGLPVGQTTTIWQIFCDEIRDFYLKRICSTGGDGPVKKSRKSKALRQFADRGEDFELVSSVFCLFLRNTSFGGIGELHRRSSALSSVSKLFHDSVTDILCPLLKATSDADKGLSKKLFWFPALLLRFALGELALYLRNIKLVEKHSEATKVLLSSEGMDKFVSVGSLDNASRFKRDKRLAYLQSAICVQKIRATCRLSKDKEEVQNEPRAKELSALASHVCTGIDNTTECIASWDGQICSINSENAPVAHWVLLARHAVILLPLCTANQRLEVANFLIKSLTQKSKSTKTDQPGHITISQVSATVIQSAEFHEIAFMQSSVLFAIWSQLHDALFPDHDSNTIARRLSKVLDVMATGEPSSEETLKLIESEVPDNLGDNIDYGNGVGNDDLRVYGGAEDGHGGDNDDDEVSELSDDGDSAVVQDGEEIEIDASGAAPKSQGMGKHQEFHLLGFEMNEILKNSLASNVVINVSPNLPDVDRLMEVLGRLPLDWFSDKNHIRCFISLLACDVLLYLRCLEKYSGECVETLSQNRKLLKVLFDGCSRRKRLILHHVVDIGTFQTWLYGSTFKLWQKYNTKEDSSAGFSVILDDTRKLLCEAFRYLVKVSSQTASIGQIMAQQLQEELRTLSSVLKLCSKSAVHGVVKLHQVGITMTEGLLRVCEEIVSNKTSPKKVVRACADHVLQLVPSILELLKVIVQLSWQSPNDGEDTSRTCLRDMLCKVPMLIDSFSSFLRIRYISQNSRKLFHLKETFELWEWQDVFRFTLTGVIHHLYGQKMQTGVPANENEAKIVHSCLRFLRVVCYSSFDLELYLPEDFAIRILASTLHLLRLFELGTSSLLEPAMQEKSPTTDKQHKDQGNDSNVANRIPSDNKQLVEEAYDLLVSLFDGCNSQYVPELLQGLCDEINAIHIYENCLPRLGVALRLWFRLLSGRFTKERRKELRPKLPQVLFALQVVLQEFKGRNHDIIILTVDVLVRILSLGKGMLLAHNALLVLHSSMMVDCTANISRFPRLFEAQFFLLSTLLFQHSEAVYGAIHVFINCVRNLLFSLLQISNDQEQVEQSFSNVGKSGHKGTVFNPADLLQSAQRMARLYQEISSHKATFSKYSPYMIIDYIHKVQTVAVPAAVRDALIPGVYCLLEICGEHELSLLHTLLEKGSRELFTSLYADYNKYHKFKGKV